MSPSSHDASAALFIRGNLALARPAPVAALEAAPASSIASPLKSVPEMPFLPARPPVFAPGFSPIAAAGAGAGIIDPRLRDLREMPAIPQILAPELDPETGRQLNIAEVQRRASLKISIPFSLSNPNATRASSGGKAAGPAGAKKNSEGDEAKPEKIEALSKLREEVRALLPSGKAKSRAIEELLARADGVLKEGRANRDEVRALALELEGAKEALGAQAVEDAPPHAIDLSGAQEITPALFLEIMRAGSVDPRGRKSAEAQAAQAAFEAGARAFFADPPKFVPAAASYWGAVAAAKKAPPDDLSREMGRAAAELLRSLWRLGRTAGLPMWMLNSKLHALDVMGLIRARGHLRGRVEILTSEDALLRQTALLLEKNMGSIMHHAARSGNPGYLQEAEAALPGMLRRLYDFAEKLRGSGDLIDRETALSLVGEAGGKRKGNVNTIVNRALHLGELGYVAKVVAAFEGEEGFLQVLKREIEALRARGEKVAADALEKNAGTIVSRALASGDLGYVAKVVAAFEGEEGFLRVLRKEIEALRARGEEGAAEALEKHVGTIVNHALLSGDLNPASAMRTFLGQ